MIKERTLLIVDFILQHRYPVTTKMIANEFNIHTRSATRYIQLISDMDYQFRSFHFVVTGGVAWSEFKITGKLI